MKISSTLARAACMAGMAILIPVAAQAGTIVNYDVSSSFFVGVGGTLSGTNGGTIFFDYLLAGNPFHATTPSVATLGQLDVTCAACTASTAANPVSSSIGAFTLDLIINDTTDGGPAQMFIGSSAGGFFYTDESTVSIIWTPASLTFGSSGQTTFSTPAFTGVNYPSPSVLGNYQVTSIQGFVSSNAVPEPATFGLMGGSLLAFSIFRKRLSRR
jgi:PEP-CTERM motif